MKPDRLFIKTGCSKMKRTVCSRIEEYINIKKIFNYIEISTLLVLTALIEIQKENISQKENEFYKIRKNKKCTLL